MSARMDNERPRPALIRPVWLLAFLVLAVPALAMAWETFLEPSRVVDLSTPYRDRIQRILVHENQRVKKGELLAELDTRVLRRRLELARTGAGFHGEVDAASAQVTRESNRLRMLEKMAASGTARPDLAVARARLQSARERQAERQLTVAVVEAQVAEKELRSPIDGVVTRIYRQEAELVGGGDSEPLMTVVRLDPLYAVFHLPPRAVERLVQGGRVRLAVNGRPVSGVIETIGPLIDARSGTIRVRIRVDNPDLTLKSGSRCTWNPEQTGEDHG